MNFKEKLKAVLETLKISANDKKITDEQWQAIEAEFEKRYAMSFAQAMAEANALAATEEDRQKALQLLNEAGLTTEDATTDEPSVSAGINALIEENRKLTTTLQEVASRVAPDNTHSVTVNVSAAGFCHSATHLFGIAHDMFALSRKWNRCLANPLERANFSIDESEERTLQHDLRAYALSVAKRYNAHKNAGTLNAKQLNSGVFTTDNSDLSSAKLGEQFVLLRQDALIARILETQDTSVFYPRRYGIQDREVMTSAFFDTVSQAYQNQEVFKGGMKLQPEIGHVDDAMFEVEFPPMKELERSYIGYLNSDGSDPMKWTMIEWILLQLYKQAQREQDIRRIHGIFVKSDDGKPGHFLNASTGVIYTLIRYVHENKLLPHSDKAYNDYTKETMLDMVLEFVADVKEKLDIFGSLSGKVLQLNARHKDWFIAGLRKAYGKDNDFVGIYTDKLPDHDLPIQWVPFGNVKLMLITTPGDIQSLEYVPGEMFKVRMIEGLKSAKVGSYWKEGVSATYVGRKFSTRQELIDNDYANQAIFMNWPSVEAQKDATTLDATKGIIQITPSNSSTTAITDITSAQPGVAYIIECGGTDNASTIAKSGKFADITSDYTPTAEGDYIMVVLNHDGDKFLELERCVGGVRTINTKLQPNIPGAR